MSVDSNTPYLADSDSEMDTYECCECNKKDKFSDLQDAYDNGWYQYDEANYCPDHTAGAIEECDTGGLVVNWSDNFGPCEIVGKVIEILHPKIDKDIISELYRFLETMGYAALKYPISDFGVTVVGPPILHKFANHIFNMMREYRRFIILLLKKYNKDGFSK